MGTNTRNNTILIMKKKVDVIILENTHDIIDIFLRKRKSKFCCKSISYSKSISFSYKILLKDKVERVSQLNILINLSIDKNQKDIFRIRVKELENEINRFKYYENFQ